MDISAITRDTGYAPHFGEPEAYNNYIDWLMSVPGWLNPERSVQHREG